MSNSVPLRQWYIEHKICVSCGQRDAFNGRQKCPECLENTGASKGNATITREEKKSGMPVYPLDYAQSVAKRQ